MARNKKSKPYKKGKRTSLYPNGWPGNLRAVLYLNSKAREARKEDS